MVSDSQAEFLAADYLPWPGDGCSLAEARSRAAGKPPSASNREDREETECDNSEQCLKGLREGHLIAYGYLAKDAAPARLIAPAEWVTFTEIEWTNSCAAEERRDGTKFVDIRVYPPLLAPCRIKLLDGKPLKAVFRDFVLNDFEVQALASVALRLAPEWSRVFLAGSCYPRGVPEWPVAYAGRNPVSFVHPDPDKRGPCIFWDPDPIEVVIAAEALRHRYATLISLLQTNQVVADGFNNGSRRMEPVSFALWSHEDFRLDARRGDLLQINPDCEDPRDPYDHYIKCYIGLMLRAATGASSEAAAWTGLLHVKPTEPHPLPSASNVAQSAPRKSAPTAKMKEAASRACFDWLLAFMQASPDERTRTKGNLLAEAQKTWPALSEREFERLWTQAIGEAPALAWSYAGAPKRAR